MINDRGPYRRSKIPSYMSLMSNPQPNALFDDHVAEVIRQQGFPITEDPRSVYDPEQLYIALERYAYASQAEFQFFNAMDECIEFGFRMAFKIFAKPKSEDHLCCLSSDLEIMKALKLSKSSGLPNLKRKGDDYVYSRDREEQVRLGLKTPNPCIAYKRTQRGNKTRLVWGYPLEMTILESRFARPLIERFLNASTPMAFGMPTYELGAKVHRFCVEGEGTTVSIDYSKFDSSLPASFIKQAFRILATWFKSEDKIAFGWSEMVRYFIHTPIVMPDGHLYGGKDHGVPSGSYFTQMIDSIINTALVFALSKACDFYVKIDSLYVLGDDAIFNVVGDVNLKAWSDYLSSYGLTLSVAKTHVSDYHFLGAFWKLGKPDLPLDKVVSKAVSPERYRKYTGNRVEGATQVTRSMASSYLSAHVIVPKYKANSIRSRDFPVGKEGPQYLSGSERFVHEEMELVNPTRRRNKLFVRYLL